MKNLMVLVTVLVGSCGGPTAPTASDKAPATAAATARSTEALVQLDKLGKRSIIEYSTNGAFPTQPAALTPAVSCCNQDSNGRRKCSASVAGWNKAEWRALDFSMDRDFDFQCSYTPGADGATFIAKAIGDLDCDGTTITYELRGFVDNGTPKTEMIEPTNAD
jgi:hypothetical protein